MQEELFVLGAPASHVVPIKDDQSSRNLSIPRWTLYCVIHNVKSQWVCQEAERWRQSQGGRTCPGLIYPKTPGWGFGPPKAELCLRAARAGQSLGKSPRLIQEQEILLQHLHKGRRSHTQNFSLLCQGGICPWPNRAIPAPKFALLSWGTRTGKVPRDCGLYQSLMMEVQGKSSCTPSSPPLLHISWVVPTVYFSNLIEEGWNILVSLGVLSDCTVSADQQHSYGGPTALGYCYMNSVCPASLSSDFSSNSFVVFFILGRKIT